ncbi:MAG: hypothetical protein ACE5IQ_07955 [Candidatus Methylomirabilales bacterium]
MREGSVVTMRRLEGVGLGLALVLGGLLAGCQAEPLGAHRGGGPNETVEQVTSWPESLAPAGGSFREVPMPAGARGSVVLASPGAAGSQEYFHALRQ